jgi:hypothetical protein
VEVNGLLDTGASVNVMPYDIGIRLGANWQQQTTKIKLGGNLAKSEARALVVTAAIDQFTPVRLAFAWTKAKSVPLILGQVNFFMEFDVCFFRARAVFEIQPKNT